MDVRTDNQKEELGRLAAALREGRRVSDSDDAITMQDLEGHILAWN
jgi:hypothetical protein